MKNKLHHRRRHIMGDIRIAIMNDNLEQFTSLLEIFDDDDCETEQKLKDFPFLVNGSTILHDAIIHERQKIAQYLIENHINLNTRDQTSDGYGETPLILAIRKRKYSWAILMLEQNETNVNLTDLFGRQPLSIAMEHRIAILIDQILSHPLFRLTLSYNPLSVAFRYRIDSELIIKMLNIGYDCPQDQRANFLTLESTNKDLTFILEQSSSSLSQCYNQPIRLEQLCRETIRHYYFKRHFYPIILTNVDKLLMGNKKLKRPIPIAMKYFICDLSLH
uniref:Alpha-latrotoxin n=1 Tax=Dermatophagoides pteronyssinus TaxID=6956 RepID=A0A6P6Y7Y5_DERPT|nr:uncharacterized protein LOC113795432 [Dermatophagoides pteronyssinus]